MLAYASVNIKPQAIRGVVVIAVLMPYSLSSQDVSQTYVRSCTPLRKDVYVPPKHDSTLKQNHLLKLLKLMYSLSDSGDYWHDTFEENISVHINMRQATEDLARFMRNDNGRLSGIIGNYIYDTIVSGKNYFRKGSERTEEVCDSKQRKYKPFISAEI